MKSIFSTCCSLLVFAVSLLTSPGLWAVEFAGYDFQVNGDAQVVDGGNTLRLTEAVNFQTGSAFVTQPFSLTDSTEFSAFFAFNMRDGANGGADGLTFTIHADAGGAAALGDVQSGLGYGLLDPSIAVEIDTWDNGLAAEGGDFSGHVNHLGINIDGMMDSVQTFAPGVSLENGTTYFVWVDYSTFDDRLEVYFSDTNAKPALPSMERILSPGLLQALGSEVYVGFTAATGGANNIHDIEAFELQWGPREDVFAGYQMTLNGTAQVVDGGSTLRLTPAINGAAGSAFISTPYPASINTSFRSFFRFRMHGRTSFDPADGLTFVVHGDPDGAMALGDGGFGLGYGDIDFSIGVEFDTWFNDGPDPDDNHIGTNFNGFIGSASTFSPSQTLGSGEVFYAWVEYDSSVKQLCVYFSSSPKKPASPVITESFGDNYDISVTFNNDPFLAGFTAATGGANNTHDIEYWDFEVFDGPLPPEQEQDQSTPIPTLSNWATLILGLLLFGLGLIKLQNRKRVNIR